MSEVKPLQILAGKLYADDWDRLKAAKEKLKLPFTVMPSKAVPGGEGRVLAIGVKPNFICDYAFVESTKSPGFITAFDWATSDKTDSRAVTAEEMLQAILGPETREVTDAEYDMVEQLAPKLRPPVDPGRSDESSYRASIADREPAEGSVYSGRRSVEHAS
jgi:hypothetical protein